MHAIQESNIKVVELMVHQGADVNHRCGSGATPLLLAINNDDVDCVNMLIQHGADVHDGGKCSGGLTLLMASVLKNNEQIMLALINAHVRIDDVTKVLGNNALMLATIHGSIECLKGLIANGAEVNQQNNDGQTALSLAAECGNADIMDLLVQHDALLNVADYSGKTALMHAAITNDANCMNILIDAGAGLDITDNAKSDALLISLIHYKGDSCPLLLIRSGCSLNNVNMDGNTALSMAVRRNSAVVVQEMIERQVNLNQCCNDVTALWYATDKCYENCMKVLLAGQADPNIGRPPLVIAARLYDNVNCVKMLLKAGADVNRTDHVYGSVIQTGAELGSYEIVKAGLDVGADVNNCEREFYFPSHYNEMALMLLFAAGEESSYFSSKHAPKAIVETRRDFSLQNLCRKEIRKHLVRARPKVNMFRLVKSLPIPEVMKKYLTYDMNL